MSIADQEAALLAALEALLPPGTAAWVSHDPGRGQPQPDQSATGAGRLTRQSCGTDAAGTLGGGTSNRDALDPLWPEELPTTPGMRAPRLREFRHGRHCARRALAALGLPPTAIPVGAGRAPDWPPGIVGSISHAGPWALAVAAPLARLRSLGADLEAALPLDPPLQPMIATPAERHWLAMQFPAAEPGKLAFCAKESAYKCLWPVERRFIEFLEIELLPGPLPGRFRTAWRGPGELAAAARLEGAIGASETWIISAAWLHADSWSAGGRGGGRE